MVPSSRCHFRGMDLSQLDFKSHLDAPKGTIYLQPMKVALKKDHFYRSVYLAWMDPQRFPEEAIKIVAELLLPKWSWLNCFFSLLLPRGGNRVLSTSQVLGTNTHPSVIFQWEKQAFRGHRVTSVFIDKWIRVVNPSVNLDDSPGASLKGGDNGKKYVEI